MIMDQNVARFMFSTSMYLLRVVSYKCKYNVWDGLELIDIIALNK